MKKGNIITAVVCIVMAVYVILTAMTYPGAKHGVPGPGMFPIIISSLMILSSISLIITSLKMKPEENVSIDISSEGSKRVYIVMAMLIAYFILFKYVGFIITTTVLLSVLIRWFSKKNIVFCIVISIVITMAVYLIFNKLLNVPLNFGMFYI